MQAGGAARQRLAEWAQVGGGLLRAAGVLDEAHCRHSLMRATAGLHSV